MECKISFEKNNNVWIDWGADSAYDNYKKSPNGNIFITWAPSDKYDKYII